VGFIDPSLRIRKVCTRDTYPCHNVISGYYSKELSSVTSSMNVSRASELGVFFFASVYRVYSVLIDVDM
jgi:hypothetical protein